MSTEGNANGFWYRLVDLDQGPLRCSMVEINHMLREYGIHVLEGSGTCIPGAYTFKTERELKPRKRRDILSTLRDITGIDYELTVLPAGANYSSVLSDGTDQSVFANIEVREIPGFELTMPIRASVRETWHNGDPVYWACHRMPAGPLSEEDQSTDTMFDEHQFIHGVGKSPDEARDDLAVTIAQYNVSLHDGRINDPVKRGHKRYLDSFMKLVEETKPEPAGKA